MMVPQDKLLIALNKLLVDSNQQTIETLAEFLQYYQAMIAAAMDIAQHETMRTLLTKVAENHQPYMTNRTFIETLHWLTRVNFLQGANFRERVISLKKIIKPYGEFLLANKLFNEIKILGVASDHGDCFFMSKYFNIKDLICMKQRMILIPNR